jgi:hypothetical protein
MECRDVKEMEADRLPITYKFIRIKIIYSLVISFLL